MERKVLLISLVIFFGTNGVVAITGGELARQNEFPFMVSVRSSTNCHICGGTIIGSRWILTSSMCYALSWFGSVQFGTNVLGNDCGEVDNTTQIMMDDALYNPWADDRPPFIHDLVLIHLSAPIPFSDHVQPVQLPELDEPWPYNKTGIILGWAGSNWTANENELRKAEFPLYTDEYCAKPSLWDGWYPSNPFVMKCGGVVNKTYYCHYDVGGPLMMGNKQYGIISYILNNACGEYPGIISPVSYFRRWIKDTTGI